MTQVDNEIGNKAMIPYYDGTPKYCKTHRQQIYLAYPELIDSEYKMKDVFDFSYENFEPDSRIEKRI